jgi:hypothetical protein
MELYINKTLVKNSSHEPTIITVGVSTLDLPRSTAVLVVMAAAILILIVITIAGNVMTIIAYIRDSRLHTVYNVYIVNLAVTDALLGLMCMPLYAVYCLTGLTWTLGHVVCKTYLVVDFTLALESVLTILLISGDRFLLLKDGTRYKSRETRQFAHVKVILSWIISLAVYAPAIIGWEYWVGESVIPYDHDCDVEFYDHAGFTVTTSVCEFVIPFGVSIVLNGYIYWEIRKREQETKYIKAKGQPQVDVGKFVLQPPAVHSGPTLYQDVSCATLYVDCEQMEVNCQSNDSDEIGLRARPSHMLSQENNDSKKNQDLAHTRVRRDLKAAKRLAALVVAFAVCWAPYTIATILVSICSYDCVNVDVYEGLSWLLYIKSAANPFLYALLSPRFRENFKRFLCIKK